MSSVAAIEYQVTARKIVDASYMHVSVPATRPPRYAVGERVTCVAPNALPELIGRHWQRCAVIGSGKTGMDTCLFLLEQGVGAERILWVMPRDAWLHDRAQWQAGAPFEQSLGRTLGEFLGGIGDAESVEDVFARLAARGVLLRIDENRRPTAYRCTTVTQSELMALRSIIQIVRKGRVTGIDNERISLQHGSEPTSAATLHIDCTADGAERSASRRHRFSAARILPCSRYAGASRCSVPRSSLSSSAALTMISRKTRCARPFPIRAAITICCAPPYSIWAMPGNGAGMRRSATGSSMLASIS